MNHTIKTVLVNDLDECEYLCYLNDECVSLNIKNKDPDETHVCELNNSSHIEHDRDLTTDPVYYYRGAKNACGKKSPQCQNNATCQSGFTYKGYRCLCTPGFVGEHCEKENWIIMTPSTVCFGAKKDFYGSFRIPTSGNIITFKLTHLSGSVSCNHKLPEFESNWGCKYSKLTSYTMGTLITDSDRNHLLPSEEYLSEEPGCGYYSLPWATPDSPVLVFDNFSTPLPVATNQEFQVWYNEDLYNCGEENNDGKTCAEVHGLYV
ncbi:hypothetical protein ACROYT_G030188 [Oculina patagonica]